GIAEDFVVEAQALREKLAERFAIERILIGFGERRQRKKKGEAEAFHARAYRHFPFEIQGLKKAKLAGGSLRVGTQGFDGLRLQAARFELAHESALAAMLDIDGAGARLRDRAQKIRPVRVIAHHEAFFVIASVRIATTRHPSRSEGGIHRPEGAEPIR